MQAGECYNATGLFFASTMKIETYLPSPSLHAYIKSYTFIESETAIENHVVPDTAMVWAIRYKGEISVRAGKQSQTLNNSVFSGLCKSSRHISYSANTANLLVVFQPWGAAAFFREPLHELLNLSVPTTYLNGYQHLQSIADQLAGQQSKPDQIKVLEKILLSKLQAPDINPLAKAAVEKIAFSDAGVSVRDLASELCVSLDVFEKRFRQWVGTTPKHFSSIVRLRNVIQTYVPGKSLTQAALEAGYYDQSHFNKDFKLFTGQAPRQFLNNQRFW